MKAQRLAPALLLCLSAASLSVLVLIALATRRSHPPEIVDPCYAQFLQMTDGGSTAEALAQGDTLFQTLLNKKPDQPDLRLLRQRLEAARQISMLIADAVKANPAAFLKGIADPDWAALPVPVSQERTAPGTLLPPARETYWSHVRVFTAVPVSRDLPAQQVTFLDRYYDLRMQAAIMETGRRVVTACPDSSEYLCYAVVLPLLYLQGRDDAWDQEAPLFALFTPKMLDLLSRFTLLQAERPGAALAIARHRARVDNKELSPTQWAADAIQTCIANYRADLAERLVGVVVTGMENQSGVTELRLRVAEGYARCGDYETAVQACERVLAEQPDTRCYGKAMVAYLGYLARAEKTEQVLATTESALQDARCMPYQVQILYLRWWALRKTERLEEAVAVAEQLVNQHSDHPAVAPVLLERATDALARQEYEKCRQLLTRLTRDFPGTESARRAGDILIRLTGNTRK